MKSAASALALTALVVMAPSARADQAAPPGDNDMPTIHTESSINDFDFFVGRWTVRHRRLKERLAGSTQWEESGGTSLMQKLMDGQGNFDDNLIELPAGPYHAVSLRSFDPKTKQWAIWWLDGRDPHRPLDPPMVGGFSRGTGTFYGDDTFNGRPIRVRYLWTDITSNSCRWQQAFSSDGGQTWETNWIMDFARVSATTAHQAAASESMETVQHLKDFAVIELRRYTVQDGQRDHFARYFESYFPEAIQQSGAIVAGEFFERDNPSMFTWIRGFHDMDDRAKANASLYYGAVWKEHRRLMNSLMVDSDNVLLLRPVTPERGITILPTVDPVREKNGAQGVVVAQIFPIQANGVDAFAQQAQSTFAGYRASGAREAGVLVTLDAANNFPQLPIRSDGPYLVWLGIFKDDEAVQTRFRPLAERALQPLSATGLLRGAPESVVLDPAPRSRLRWWPAQPS